MDAFGEVIPAVWLRHCRLMALHHFAVPTEPMQNTNGPRAVLDHFPERSQAMPKRFFRKVVPIDWGTDFANWKTLERFKVVPVTGAIESPQNCILYFSVITRRRSAVIWSICDKILL